jgi:hypothetical protein
MYLSSFAHRDDLFDITERWLCGRLEPNDGLRITQILISDGFVLGETIKSVAKLLIEMTHGRVFRQERLLSKGQLRDAICRTAQNRNSRTEELVRLYETDPEFFYREAPINGAIYVDERERLLGLYRIKRPRRIAEKANRYVANWIFRRVKVRAKEMAKVRARQSEIPLERLVTSKTQMDYEFITAEKDVAQQFKGNSIKLDKPELTIHDVGGIKIVAHEEELAQLEDKLSDHPNIRIIDRENFSGNYQATSLIIEATWDREVVRKLFIDKKGWERYLDRGIPEAELKKGLEFLLDDAKPTLYMELILSTFPDMVESELGDSLHEERIVAQRDNKIYKGYIPMNVEFLIEYLFAVGACPHAHIDQLPIKIWGRYLPDTVIAHIRELFRIPECELCC